MGRSASRKKRRVYGQANKEVRNQKIIKAYRVMDPENSLEIAAVTEDLDWDEDRLQYEKVPKSHKAYILDPRHVTPHFRNGFEKGFTFARALDATREQGDECEDWIDDATIGGIFVRNRKHVLATVVSKKMSAETVAMKQVLGDEGVRGLRGSRANRAGGLTIHIAQLKPDVLPDQKAEASYLDALETAFVVHSISRIAFGPVQVIDR